VPAQYRDVLEHAASAKNTSVALLAALFLTENGNVWKPFPYDTSKPGANTVAEKSQDTSWSGSPAGAQGPFQFLIGTWNGHRTDGSGDGKTDVNNMWDAAYSAADMIASMGAKASTPLGDRNQPMKRNTLLYFAAAYNGGPGWADSMPESSTLADLGVGQETYNYVTNVYANVSSNFTKGDHPNYPSTISPTISGSDSGSTSSTGSTTPAISINSDCAGASGGIVSGNIAKTALGLAWPNQGHGKNQADATKAYQTTMPQYEGLKESDDDAFSDCGVFVATVMRSSGADPKYWTRTTTEQLSYVRSQPSKYKILGTITSTAQLQAGDILISDTHTYIYTGKYTGSDSKTYTAAAASWHDHVPEADNFYADGFTGVRLVNGGTSNVSSNSTENSINSSGAQ
jgi:hypothetical protein